MIDIVSSIRKLKKEGKAMAIATVVKTWKSSPRPVGSSLVITADGEMIGSVSGGCVESTVVRQGLKVIESGTAIQMHFGVSDEDAWEVGLSCGGELEVFIQPFFSEAIWKKMDDLLERDQGFSILMGLEGQTQHSLITASGEIFGDSVDKSTLTEIEKAYYEGDSKTLNNELQFLLVLPKKPMLIMIGAAHVTVALTEMARMFGFETLLIDPRAAFAEETIYSVKPDQIKTAWPQQILPNLDLNKNTYSVILSHDPKIDDEALKILLKSNIRYIGALGSKKTHAKRVQRLTDHGFSMAQINKISAPIGLDIGSKMPREIALSIMAEIIKVKNSPIVD
jgi:xanthine dehydrogenase accessory factor